MYIFLQIHHQNYTRLYTHIHWIINVNNFQWVDQITQIGGYLNLYEVIMVVFVSQIWALYCNTNMCFILQRGFLSTTLLCHKNIFRWINFLFTFMIRNIMYEKAFIILRMNGHYILLSLKSKEEKYNNVFDLIQEKWNGKVDVVWFIYMYLLLPNTFYKYLF